MIEDQIREQHTNFVCLWIDSPGGSLIDSMNLANFLADLDRSQVRTVAYVPSEARGDAALVALACDQLVMNHEATLGGSGAEEFSAEEMQSPAKCCAIAWRRRNGAPGRCWTRWSIPRPAFIDTRISKDGAVEYFWRGRAGGAGRPRRLDAGGRSDPRRASR